MPMHPHFKEDDLFLVASLIFSDDKNSIIEKLLNINLIHPNNKNIWINKLSELNNFNNTIENIATNLKFIIDPIVSKKGVISSSRSIDLIANIINTAKKFDEEFFYFKNIQNKTALDFGSGIYNPLSVSIIKFANGFQKTFSFEPYKIFSNYSYYSTIEVISKILQNPLSFNFSGIDLNEMKFRVSQLDLTNLENKFHLFSENKLSEINLGNVILTKNMSDINDNSLDFQSSNAVLEHVSDLDLYIEILFAKMKSSGTSLHIVDFLDHRHYNNSLLHPFEKYYDGVLDEINGLTPPEMENLFLNVGFKFDKLIGQSVPSKYLDEEKRMMKGKYSSFNKDSLLEHVNYYYLKK